MTMNEGMQVKYDKEGDILKITIGSHGKSKYKELGDGVFQCIDEKTKETTAIAIFTFKKRMEAGQTIEIPASLRIKVNR